MLRLFRIGIDRGLIVHRLHAHISLHVFARFADALYRADEKRNQNYKTYDAHDDARGVALGIRSREHVFLNKTVAEKGEIQ